MAQPFTLLGLLYYLGGTVKSLLALLSGVVVAYTNDGYLRDAYRRVSRCTNKPQGPPEA